MGFVERRSIERLLAFALSGLVLVAYLSVDAMRLRQLAETKIQLDAGNWGAVEKRMNDFRHRAFCRQIGGWVDQYLAEMQMHNSVARLYNDAVSRSQTADRPTEPMMERESFPVAGINGLIFMAHIDPWQDCMARYRIYRRS